MDDSPHGSTVIQICISSAMTAGFMSFPYVRQSRALWLLLVWHVKRRVALFASLADDVED